MDDEVVVDASVLGAAFFNEEHSGAARTYVSGQKRLIAPELIQVEVASLAAKKVWRKEASLAIGTRSLRVLPEFVAEFVASASLAPRALALAAEHRSSAYDAMYLALAEQRSTFVATLDRRLVERTRAAGLGSLVRLVGAESHPGSIAAR